MTRADGGMAIECHIALTVPCHCNPYLERSADCGQCVPTALALIQRRLRSYPNPANVEFKT